MYSHKFSRTYLAPNSLFDSIIQVYVAPTSGLKGLISYHTWISFKSKEDKNYTVIEVCDRDDLLNMKSKLLREWGIENHSVRLSYRWPDRKWYGNKPKILYEARGSEAEKYIKTIKNILHLCPNEKFHYLGPNCNSLASFLIKSSGIPIMLPWKCIGKNYNYDLSDRARLVIFKEKMSILIHKNLKEDTLANINKTKFSISKIVSRYLAKIIKNENIRLDLEYLSSLELDQLIDMFVNQIAALKHITIDSDQLPLIKAKAKFNQVPCHPETNTNRVEIINKYNVNSIIFLGDDDLTSISLKNSKFQGDIIAFDIDDDVVNVLMSNDINAKKKDFYVDKDPIVGRVRSIFLDPPYDKDSVIKFLSYGIRHLQDESYIFLNINQDLIHRNNVEEIKNFLLAKGFKLIDVYENLSYYPISVERSLRYKKLSSLFVNKKSLLYNFADIPGYTSDLLVFRRETT